MICQTKRNGFRKKSKSFLRFEKMDTYFGLTWGNVRPKIILIEKNVQGIGKARFFCIRQRKILLFCREIVIIMV